MEYVLIKFYTKEPKPPELYCLVEQFDKFLERFRELTQNKAKFVVYRFDNYRHMIGDFS